MIGEKIQLKEKLIQIERDGYQVDGSVNTFELALEMMNYIGHIDPELRDNLIYSTFAHWINHRFFTEEQLSKLLHISLDEQHLFYGIGEKDTDSVFTRSFSVLIIPLIMGIDRRQSFLVKDDVILIKNSLIKYTYLEQDVRGYIEGKGWAHAVAHVSDAFEDMANSPFMEKVDLIEILNAIKSKILVSNNLYINEEDERLVTAIISIFNRELLEVHDINAWIHSFSEVQQIGKQSEDNIRNMNIKCLLRSLYFRLLDQQQSSYTGIIIATLQNLEAKKG